MSADLVAKLRDLGISEGSARFALAKCNNNVEQAAEYVFSGKASQDEVSTDSKDADKGSPVNDPSSTLEPKESMSVEPKPKPKRPRSLGSRSRSNSRSRENSISLSLAPTLSRGQSGTNTPPYLSRSRGSIRDRLREFSLELTRRPPTPIVEGFDVNNVLTQDPEHEPKHELEPKHEPKPTPNYDKQSNDLIMSALGRRSSTPAGRSHTSTPATHKPTAGALAALGMGAARIGAPGSMRGTPATSGRNTPSQHHAPPVIAAPPPAQAAPAPAPIQTSVPNPPTINTPIAPTPVAHAGPQVHIADNPTIASNKPTTPIDANPTPILHRPTPDRSHLLPSRPLGVSGMSSGMSTPMSGSERPSREPSPFYAARKSREERRARDKSPDIGALRKDSIVSAADSDGESVGRVRGRAYRPRSSAYDSPDESGNEADDNEDSQTEDDDLDGGNFDDDDDELWDADHFFDEETEKNTEANAVYLDDECVGPDGVKRENFDVFGEETEQDMLGEGPNVIMAPEPLFALPEAKARKSQRGLDVITSRPMFARDRCTINIVQGDPDEKLDESGKRMRRYVVLSDLSEESRYAVQWAVGTVARDGDEIFLISVIEDENKVDPKHWSSRDQAQKMKLQKERQTTALLLVRQITSLLERTHLNITVTCQALHAKNARYMLLDLIDFLEPTLVIVGSRGLGQIKGILLGSTSHYLVQKSSVPVMVARRRLRRPLRRTNPEDLRRSPRVSLASANIEKTASSKQEDDIVDATDDDLDPKHLAEKSGATSS